MATSGSAVDSPENSRSEETGPGCGEDPAPGASLHKRRFDAKRGDLPETLTVHARRSLAVDDGPSPRLTPDGIEWVGPEDGGGSRDPDTLCDAMLRRLEGRTDPLSARSRDVALATRATVEALDHLEKLYELMDRLLQLKEHNERALRRARDARFVANLADAHRQIEIAMERARKEGRELTLHNEALSMDLDAEYGYTEALLESLLAAGRGASMKRAGSRWKAQKFRGSLLRKQRSRSVGGEESEGGAGSGASDAVRLSVPQPPKPRRSSEECRKMDKSKVSKWTKVKAYFKWENAHTGVAAGAVGAAGALVGAVALAGTSAPTTPVTPAPAPHDDSVSVTPGSVLSLTPNSSCEELRMDSGICRKIGYRCDENENTFLHAPVQDDSSTSPSPNKLHKSPWGKMRDIIHTRKESVRRKQRSLRSSGGPAAGRRRSFSDGGESDAPPALTLTIPSSEELEGEPPAHTALRKQRSLELGSAARPPPGAARRDPARASKWSKVKRAFLSGASASVPCSPDRHREFFPDRDAEAVSSGCEAGGSGGGGAGGGVRDEIRRDYAALQSRLHLEFSGMRPMAAMRPVATEDQLSADFRKKLTEWQRMKGGGGGAGAARQPPPVPDRSDLSEDFLKKWDEWKRLKETNSVPAWGEEARPDEVLVQTSTGFFRFQGISRSFTRKLHEWEKARGIAPEASTSALLRAAQGARGGVGGGSKPSAGPPLARAQSAGSVAPSSSTQSVRALHASSLSVNDADHLEMGYEQDDNSEAGDGEGGRSPDDRAAVLVEVEAREECTAAPLVAVSPRHTPQTPVYTYDHDEPARLLCETSPAAALLQREPLLAGDQFAGSTEVITHRKDKSTSSRSARNEKKDRRAIIRQPSIEDDAQFIRRTIEEIERGSSSRVDIQEESRIDRESSERNLLVRKACDREEIESSPTILRSTQADVRKDDDVAMKNYDLKPSRKNNEDETSNEHQNEDTSRRKEAMEKGSNGKKKAKARARLEREHSKPSESDSEPDLDIVTVEIPRRRKRPRRPSEKPRTPPPSASAASDTEGEVFVLKLRASEQQRCGSPEVIVKTKRKIFSPVVRSGESTPRAVIPVDVEELAEVRPRAVVFDDSHRIGNYSEDSIEARAKGKRGNSRKSQDDLAETRSRLQLALENMEQADDQRPRSRPPLPSSPSAQRRPPPKETAPSIRIMIQRYNMKINEDGHTSPASSGASSPAWRSPAAERRRPPDMPHQVNIRNNPFVAREVQKSVSACQLSRREASSSERRLEPPPTETTGPDGVLKSHSACALHPLERNQQPSPSPMPLREEPEDDVKPSKSMASSSVTSVETSASTSISRQNINEAERPSTERTWRTPKPKRPSIERFISSTSTGSVGRVSLERIMSGITKDKRPSVERMMSTTSTETATESEAPKESMTPSERTQRIRAARERFLSSPGPVRRDLSGSAGELRPGDSRAQSACPRPRRCCARDCIRACCRSSRASCSSDVGCAGAACAGTSGGAGALGRSASTGMVNVERDAWERVCESGAGGQHPTRRGRFSLARLAARLRRRADPGAVSRLCRQSLLVQLRPQQQQ